MLSKQKKDVQKRPETRREGFFYDFVANKSAAGVKYLIVVRKVKAILIFA